MLGYPSKVNCVPSQVECVLVASTTDNAVVKSQGELDRRLVADRLAHPHNEVDMLCDRYSLILGVACIGHHTLDMTRAKLEETCEGLSIDREREAILVLEFEPQSVAMTGEVNDLGFVV